MKTYSSPIGHSARINHLRDEELYLRVLKDHIPRAAIAMLDRKLESIRDEKKIITEELSIVRNDTRLPSFTYQYTFDGDGKENLINQLVTFLDVNIMNSSVQVFCLNP